MSTDHAFGVFTLGYGRFGAAGLGPAGLILVILIILATIVLKNVLVWISGQLGAQLQEYVTRDLRNTVYEHLQRLPIGSAGAAQTRAACARSALALRRPDQPVVRHRRIQVHGNSAVVVCGPQPGLAMRIATRMPCHRQQSSA